MRVIVVHNAYQQRGGEDSVVDEETQLLRRYGHAVETYTRHNDEIGDLGRYVAVRDTVWSERTVRELATRISQFQPDLMHVHNTFPLISPSVYHVAAKARLPVVQTLHNFRLACPQAMFLRAGRVCEDCLGKLPWRGIVHRCYRNSASQTAVIVGMLGIHRALRTYRRGVTRYIALSRFSRDKLVEAGLAANRIAIKPNFVDLPAPEPQVPRTAALFVGRLSPEKGTRVLAIAARSRADRVIDVVGTGPEETFLAEVPGMRLHGWQISQATYALMRQSAYLVMPSVWYENFPRTLVEAFACATPVIASRLGAMAEIVKDGETGLLFEPGSAEDLGKAMQWADSHPDEMRRMGEAARREYEAKYTPQANIDLLTQIYQTAQDEVRPCS